MPILRRSCLILLLALWLLLRIPLAHAESCQFVLGFQTLHNLIPTIVGDCLDNEQHNPVNGDAL
ncbi:MAG: hypothetical protein ACR2JY_14920 [Chloroflexota bacterium]